jgi:hypothetical protein
MSLLLTTGGGVDAYVLPCLVLRAAELSECSFFFGSIRVVLRAALRVVVMPGRRDEYRGCAPSLKGLRGLRDILKRSVHVAVGCP